MVRHWAMRFEAKHQYFKYLATSMGNYINVAKSLANRHQCYQCYLFQNDDILKDAIESGPGTYVITSIYSHREYLIMSSPKENGPSQGKLATFTFEL